MFKTNVTSIPAKKKIRKKDNNTCIQKDNHASNQLVISLSVISLWLYFKTNAKGCTSSDT